jgi:iron(III) transport system substrate-binding protein
VGHLLAAAAAPRVAVQEEDMPYMASVLVRSGLVVAALLLGLSACAPAAPSGGSAPAPAAPPAPAPAASAPEWQAAWEQTLAAARQEGTVVIALPVGGLWRDWARRFERAYPGISVDASGFAGRDFVPRVLGERRGDIFNWDVYVGGPESAYAQMKPEGVLDPLKPALVLPEILDDGKWLGGFGQGFADLDGTHVYAFNGQLQVLVWVYRDFVSEAELNRIDDLTQARWKGRMSWADPRGAGKGQADATHLLMTKGEPWFREFVAQEPILVTDGRPQVDPLTRGQFPIAISPAPATMTEYRKQGVGLNVKPLDPQSEAGVRLAMVRSVALINRAPHPNAARVFVNWVLSVDGQKAFAELLEEYSRRLDVGGPADMQPEPAVTYRPVNREENQEYVRQANGILREMLK